ncbi:MAG: LysR family transcriptional regulator [Eubacterium sp.]
MAKYKSFTKAADILHNNQPNITRCMNNLEQELECTLFPF